MSIDVISGGHVCMSPTSVSKSIYYALCLYNILYTLGSTIDINFWRYFINHEVHEMLSSLMLTGNIDNNIKWYTFTTYRNIGIQCTYNLRYLLK